MYDYHVHSNYSDGSFLRTMTEAADDAGLEGVGFADHCNVSGDEEIWESKLVAGFNLDQTYSRRRDAIEALRDDAAIEIYDAVEMDYEPDEEERIREFLAEAEFDYALGSVHYLDRGGEYVGVGDDSHAESLSPDERRAFVDDYYDTVADLIRSELFDVVAHLDFFETSAVLRGHSTTEHYERVADALEASRTVPEINAGFVGEWGDYEECFPAPEFLDVLLDRGIDVTVGTDSHDPEEFDRRVPKLSDYIEDRGVDPVSPFDAAEGR
ncbi:histidinol-phosphatase [Halobacteriales archaeon QS_1_67_19]|nr:MAG: histidinol-phosphatase [Halobacteriales archaeon QS_1_67_19]